MKDLCPGSTQDPGEGPTRESQEGRDTVPRVRPATRISPLPYYPWTREPGDPEGTGVSPEVDHGDPVPDGPCPLVQEGHEVEGTGREGPVHLDPSFPSATVAVSEVP